MGFYLWVDEELAWARGTYEYRPMGTAVRRERPAPAQLPICTACDNGKLLDEPPAQIL
jgi:hypothetical protein